MYVTALFEVLLQEWFPRFYLKFYNRCFPNVQISALDGILARVYLFSWIFFRFVPTSRLGCAPMVVLTKKFAGMAARWENVIVCLMALQIIHNIPYLCMHSIVNQNCISYTFSSPSSSSSSCPPTHKHKCIEIRRVKVGIHFFDAFRSLSLHLTRAGRSVWEFARVSRVANFRRGLVPPYAQARWNHGTPEARPRQRQGSILWNYMGFKRGTSEISCILEMRNARRNEAGISNFLIDCMLS